MHGNSALDQTRDQLHVDYSGIPENSGSDQIRDQFLVYYSKSLVDYSGSDQSWKE